MENIVNTEREVIVLDPEQHHTLCREQYYADEEGVEHSFSFIERTHEGGGRHTESWSVVLQRDNDKKFFGVGYDDSVKDSMGWRECNADDSYEAVQLFPRQIMAIVYE